MSRPAGEVIRDRRKHKCISLTELAEMVGTTKSYQSLVESGKRTPTDSQIDLFAQILEVPADLLRVASGKVPNDVATASASVTSRLVSLARQQMHEVAFSARNSTGDIMRTVLEANAKRGLSFSGQSYAGELKFGKNTNSYRTHSYHTKVPPEIIVPVIEHYTKPGDVVFDPFCGSGMTGVAALRCGRHAVLSDISPAAVHIAGNYVTACDPKLLQESVRQLSKRLGPTMAWLYGITSGAGERRTIEYTTWSDCFKCCNCGSVFSYWVAARGHDGLILGDTFPCPECKRAVHKRDLVWVGEEPVESNVSSDSQRYRDVHPPTADELQLITESNAWEIPYFVPDVPFENTREMWRASHGVMGINTVADFYTKRNLHALAALRHEILQEPDVRIRNALLFGFTAIANRASKRYQWNAKRPTNVMTGTMYISSLRYEWNVWSLFARKMREVIRYFSEFPKAHSVIAEAVLASATNVPWLPDNSVDFVFMDPPFGSNIFYSDVSLLWESWLGLLTDDKEEMVVSKRREGISSKTLNDYSKLLASAFTESQRVLKRNARSVLVFSNTNDEVWAAVQSAIASADLEVECTAILDKVHRSIKGVKADLGKENVTRFDLMLTLRSRRSSSSLSKTQSEPLADEVRQAARDYLTAVGDEGCQLDEIYSHVLGAFISRQRSVRGISMTFVESICIELAERGSDGKWRVKALAPDGCKFIDIGSKYGCVIKEYLSTHFSPTADDKKRKPKRVKRPTVESVEATRNSAFYNAHSYPTKVPPEAIIPYIEHFTRCGDVVLDPFSGSGMTGVAASMTGRRAILNDISVTAAHLAYNHTRPCAPDELAEAFEQLYKRARPRFEKLYAASNELGLEAYVNYTIWSKRLVCENCGHSFLLWDAIDQTTGRMGKSVPCTSCNSEVRRTSLASGCFEPAVADLSLIGGSDRRRTTCRVTSEDVKRLSELETCAIEDWYPRVPLGPDRDMYNLSALHLQGIHEVSDFYTRRNLMALAMLWSSIQEIQNLRIRHALEFAFTNTAWHGTKMRRFNARGGQRPLTGTLFVPQLSSEVNVLEVMRNKISQLKRYYAEYAPKADIEMPQVRVGSATRLSGIPDESIDYVFTDPPFGSNIYYADCNVVFEAWLGGLTQTSDEAVVNRTIKPEAGGKTIADYQALMTNAFTEMARVLKPRAWATLVFHNTDSEIWRAMQAAAVSAGFELEHAAGLDRKQQSHKGYKGRSGEENVAHFDVIMSMRKNSVGVRVRNRPVADESVIRDAINEIVTSMDVSKISTQFVHSAVLRRLVQDGFDLGSISYASIREMLESM